MKPLFFLFVPLALLSIPYEVTFIGMQDSEELRSLLDASTLVTLQDRPPASLNALRYRAASDTPDLLEVLRAYGYYDASIRTEIDAEEGKTTQVYLYIHPGTQYTLASYRMSPSSFGTCSPIQIPLGRPALSADIINDELQVLTELSRCGYPLASIEKRTVEVDMMEKEVHAHIVVDEGPHSRFGPTAICGLDKVKERFLLSKIAWEEGDIYNSDCVEATQKKLLNTNLFSSVYITHDERTDPTGILPMTLQVEESLNRQFGMGVYYATVDGPGGQFSWSNRNIRGLGETLSLDGEFSARYLAGSLVYKMPDFFVEGQTYKALGEIQRQNIHPYTAFIYRIANYLERKLDSRSYFAIGCEWERFNVANSAANGTFWMADLPFIARYVNADDLLNPTKGYTLVYQASPYQSLTKGSVHFIKQIFTATFYIPWFQRKLVWAARAQFGSIAGAAQSQIPLPVLFLGGSEDDLRGYRYYTVSPLNEHNQPLGGRSAIYLSWEARLRLTKTIGVVPFFDAGTVTFNELPTVDAKWYKSIGAGLRYFTFFGPIRVDVGFPLDRRNQIDAPYRFYVSVGQTY